MKILYFAPLYFDDMKQRPQQIAECLSKHNRVYYVEPTVSLVRWAVKRGKTFRGYRKRINRNLQVIRLDGMFTFHKSIEILDPAGLNSLSEYMQIKRLAEGCDVIWVGYSGWYTLVRHFRQKPVVFDWMDQEDMLVSPRLWKMTLRRNTVRLAESSALVFATCMKFYEQLQAGGKAWLVPNAVSEDFISGLAEDDIDYAEPDDAESDYAEPDYAGPDDAEKKSVRIFGYVGTIGEWFDERLVYRLLELDPHCEVILAGRNCMPEIRSSRVRYLGVRPHRELPRIIKDFDVCLYNFKRTPLLDTINPVKIYEYLALNKPVLAVAGRETRRLGDYLTLYENAETLGEKELGRLKRPFGDSGALHRFIRENCWQERTAEMERIMRSTLHI